MQNQNPSADPHGWWVIPAEACDSDVSKYNHKQIYKVSSITNSDVK